MKGPKEDQRGFSLVELILVMAIIGILAGGSALMMGQLRAANVNKATEDLNSQISKLQTRTMSKSVKPYLYVYQFNGSYYMKVLDGVAPTDASLSSRLDADGTKLGGGSITIYGVDSSGATTTVSGSDYICIAYTRALTFDTSTTAEKVILAGSATKTIVLTAETGKHRIL